MYTVQNKVSNTSFLIQSTLTIFLVITAVQKHTLINLLKPINFSFKFKMCQSQRQLSVVSYLLADVIDLLQYQLEKIWMK